jgi:hypothetical protein
MILITPSFTVYDTCDASPQVSLKTIVMNEGDTTNTYDPMFDDKVSDGNTRNDIEVTADGSIYLRAERKGTNKDGRIYTITYEAVDASGNSATSSAMVRVPHDLGFRPE